MKTLVIGILGALAGSVAASLTNASPAETAILIFLVFNGLKSDLRQTTKEE